MAFPFAPVASAGASIFGQVISNQYAKEESARDKIYANEVYERQRRDAMSDWNMQNAYNTPAAQMQRYKDAGLNPNLIYGNQTNSPTVRSTDHATPQGRAKTMDLSSVGNSIMGYAELKQRDAQTNILQTQIETEKLRQLNIMADTNQKITATDLGKYSLQFKQRSEENNLAIINKQLELMQGKAAHQWQTNEQEYKAFPQKLANQILVGNKLQSDIQTQGSVRSEIAQRISASLTNQTLNELKIVEQRHENEMWQEIHQIKITELKIKSGQLSKQDGDKELQDAQDKFRKLGLSPTATQDLIEAIIQGVGISKGLGGLKPPSPTSNYKPSYKTNPRLKVYDKKGKTMPSSWTDELK